MIMEFLGIQITLLFITVSIKLSNLFQMFMVGNSFPLIESENTLELQMCLFLTLLANMIMKTTIPSSLQRLFEHTKLFGSIIHKFTFGERFSISFLVIHLSTTSRDSMCKILLLKSLL